MRLQSISFIKLFLKLRLPTCQHHKMKIKMSNMNYFFRCKLVSVSALTFWSTWSVSVVTRSILNPTVWSWRREMGRENCTLVRTWWWNSATKHSRLAKCFIKLKGLFPLPRVALAIMFSLFGAK